MRLIKCQQCNGKFASNTIIKFTDTYGKKPKIINICSQQCIDAYCINKDLKKKDSENYAILLQYIMDLHDISFVPNLLHIRLNDLKNGVVRNGNTVQFQTKGVNWSDLLVAYQYSADTIKKIKLTKSFNNISNELMYCLSIVKNNFYKAKQLNDQHKLNNQIDIHIPNNDLNNYTYKKAAFKDDISDIL